MTVYCNIIKLLVVEELYSVVAGGHSYDISVSEKGIITKISGSMPIVSTCSKHASKLHSFEVYYFYCIYIAGIVVKYHKIHDISEC